MTLLLPDDTRVVSQEEAGSPSLAAGVLVPPFRPSSTGDRIQARGAATNGFTGQTGHQVLTPPHPGGMMSMLPTVL